MLKGIVVQRPAVDFAFIRAEAGVDYFCHISRFPLNDIGLRSVQPGDAVQFDLDADALNIHEKPRAINVVRLDTLQPRPNYREYGVCIRVSEKKDYCFLRRPDTSQLYCHVSGVTSRLHKHFEIGQIWNYAVAPPFKKGLCWQAINAVELSNMPKNSESDQNVSTTDQTAAPAPVSRAALAAAD